MPPYHPRLIAYDNISVVSLTETYNPLSPRQDVKSSGTSTAEGISASDFIAQAENHWTVSATSILAAWAGTILVIIICILIYSAARRRWKLIYLPRIKLRKRSKTPEEKAAEKKSLRDRGIDLEKMSAARLKEFKRQRHYEKPEWYPEGKNKDGIWVSRAPRDEFGFLQWLKPTFSETAIEFKSIIPMWIRRCCGFRRKERGEGSKHRTLFEQDVKLLEMLGLDAMVHLLFLRLLKYLFATISILAIALALANYYINTQTQYGGTEVLSVTQAGEENTKSRSDKKGNRTSIIDNPQLLTAANIKSNGLMVHISFEVIVTVLVMVFVLKASSHHLELVQEWTHLNYNEVSFKTLMITNLGIRYKPDKQLATIADARRHIRTLVLGYAPESKDSKSRPTPDERLGEFGHLDAKVWFAVHNMNPLHERVEEFKERYFKLAIKAVALETFYGRGKGVFYDSWKDVICGRAKSPRSRVQEAVREKQKIEEMQEEIRQDQKHIEDTDLRGTVTSAFITVPTAKDARNILKQKKEGLREAGYFLQRAPRSHNVLWKNLEKDAKSRHSHAATGKIALWVLCFFNTIPVMLVVLLTNVGIAIDRYPKLAQMKKDSVIWSTIFTFLEGTLPAIVSAIFSYLLPYAMRRINKWSGALTRGQLDKAVIRQLFVFLLVSNFIVFSLLGVVYESYLTIASKINKESWSAIYANLGDLPAKVTRAYISESLFWLSWYPIRSIVMWLQLLQIPRLLIKTPKLLRMKTPDDLADVAQSITFEAAIECSYLLFATVVGLVYAPLAPMVVICATIHFWSASLVHSQSLKFVNDTKETDGQCWKVLINRVLAATVLMHCMMVLTVALKTRSAVMALGAAAPMVAILWFKLYLSRHYDTDGAVFSIYIDKYKQDEEGAERSVPTYKHDLLRVDWMPKGKTVKNERLLEAAMKRFPRLRELFEMPSEEKASSSRRRWKKRHR